MALSIFQKVRTIGLSNLHTVLNKVIDLNSIGAIEQHIRDLESARADLEGTLAEAKYDLTKQEGDVARINREIAGYLKSIQTLQTANNGKTEQNAAAALNLAKSVNKLRDSLPKEEADVTRARETVASLQTAVDRLTDKEKSMKNSLADLRTMQATAKSKERAAQAIEAAGTALDGSASIDNVADRVNREHARAEARLDRAMGTMQPTAADEEETARAQALLAELTGKPAAPAQ